MVTPFLAGAFSLLGIYVKTVELHDQIAQRTVEIQAMETESAELKGHILELLGSNHLKTFAAEQSLVEEKNPSYLKAQASWGVFASR